MLFFRWIFTIFYRIYDKVLLDYCIAAEHNSRRNRGTIII
jgi:hypothetical protein